MINQRKRGQWPYQPLFVSNTQNICHYMSQTIQRWQYMSNQKLVDWNSTGVGYGDYFKGDITRLLLSIFHDQWTKSKWHNSTKRGSGQTKLYCQINLFVLNNNISINVFEWWETFIYSLSVSHINSLMESTLSSFKLYNIGFWIGYLVQCKCTNKQVLFS